MGVVLWHIEVSHFNEKARWALDYKRIPHERRAPMPALTQLVALWLTRGGQRRFPVLDLDGRHIGDSTAIVAALEERWPEPPLYPADPAERVRALELEDFFDEQVAPHVRRFIFHHTLPDFDLVVDSLLPHASERRRALMRRSAPVANRLVRTDYGIDDETAARSLEKIRAGMGRLEAEIQPSGYLVGDAFSVADLAGAALFTPLLLPPERQYPPRGAAPAVLELREELSARPGGRWVAEMYSRHRGESAEVSGEGGIRTLERG